MSYPDITLLLDICATLDVTEHELLTASVDTQKRSAERMAEKYQRLTRGFCVFMCIILGGVLLGFGIAAIVSHDLWFLPSCWPGGRSGSRTNGPSPWQAWWAAWSC